ncbi:MAG: hypothetical protein HY270_04710 [Deltaproteobacteria bacterium]|nr:hypothetical protein [Deltaproteobacteria bacterium]
MRRPIRFGFPALLIVAVGLEISAAGTPVSNPDMAAVVGTSPSERYDEARRLMQGGRYSDAARVYRSVADSTDAPTALRAQALFASGLMEENARDYERALQVYGEVERRFPDTEGARRSHNELIEFEEGGVARTIEFRRRWDAVWDELSPAQTLADQNDLRSARPGFEHAAVLLEAMLRDFSDLPRAKEVAITLGLRLASRLALATALLGLLAVVGALFLKYFTDQNSPLESESAALLVLLPGIAGQLVSLGFSGGLRTQLHWEDRRATGAAAVLGALAALATAICVVNAFNLFPFLDSNL